MKRGVLALAGIVAALAAACSSPAPNTPPAARSTGPGVPGSVSPSRVGGAGRPVPAPGLPAPTKTLIVVEENHGEQAALAGMPYLAGLSATYGYAADYHALAHPSLPNYLALAGGSTFGVTDDAPPAAHPVPGRSVFGQAIASGRTAKAYLDSMTEPCQQSDSGSYAVRHNPWAYFADPAERTLCRTYDVPLGSLSAGALHDDVTAGRLPTVAWVTPDVCHDAHDCPLGSADDWLRSWLPVIMAGPDYRSERLSIVVTFDEDEGTGGNTVLTTVVAPRLRHLVASTPCTHYCWTRYADQLAGAPPLNQAAQATSLGAAFGLG